MLVPTFLLVKLIIPFQWVYCCAMGWDLLGHCLDCIFWIIYWKKENISTKVGK